MIYLFETDLSGKLKNHIIAFGHAEHWFSFTQAIRHYSDQVILFITQE